MDWTDQQIEELIKVTRDNKDYHDTNEDLKIYREYMKGKHNVVDLLSAKQKKTLGKVLYENYADNLCRQIIAESASRTKLLGFSCPDEKVLAFISRIVSRFRLQARQESIHVSTYRDGNHCIGLGIHPETLKLRLTTVDWWDGEKGVFIIYNEYDELVMAVNEFRISPQEKMRYVYVDGKVITYTLDSVGKVLTRKEAPWMKKDNTPLAVPFVHFNNLTYGRHRLYGSSELAGGIITEQNQINVLHFCLLSNAQYNGFRMFWGTGVDASEVENVSERGIRPTEEISTQLEPSPGSMLSSTNEDAKFGTFDVATSQPIIDALRFKLQRVGQGVRVPNHYITGGDWPSGDALIRAEMPAINKARDQINCLIPSWVEVMHRMIEIQNAYGSAEETYDEDFFAAPITASFLDPERTDIVAISSALHNLRGLISVEQGLRILGYNDTQIPFIMQELSKLESDKHELISKENA